VHCHGSSIVPDMTYNEFGGTLNLAQSINLMHIHRIGLQVELSTKSR